jgi:four helix bundle protein
MGISKSEIGENTKESQDGNGRQRKKYDLEERTEHFSIRVRNFCLRLKKDTINIEYIRQLVRSGASVAGNYLEANENLGEGDLKYRIKVCRKESKESKLWLKHVLTYDSALNENERKDLIQEAFELENIFGAILKKLVWKDELRKNSNT